MGYTAMEGQREAQRQKAPVVSKGLIILHLNILSVIYQLVVCSWMQTYITNCEFILPFIPTQKCSTKIVS